MRFRKAILSMLLVICLFAVSVPSAHALTIRGFDGATVSVTLNPGQTEQVIFAPYSHPNTVTAVIEGYGVWGEYFINLPNQSVKMGDLNGNLGKQNANFSYYIKHADSQDMLLLRSKVSYPVNVFITFHFYN